MLPSFATETVVRIRPAQITERGATFRDWEHATSENIAGCHMQPDATSSDYSDREQAQATYTLWAPVNADIRKGDKISARGATYEVIGVPFVWYSPRNSVDHLTCRLIEWEG